MLEFLNEAVRKEFHLLPLDRQIELTRLAETAARNGQVVTVLYAEGSEKTSEVTIRVDKKFNVTA